MAIGLSLTPRGYNIDTTGKAYTLDPAPLQRASERNFALQRESQQGMYDAARKGFDFLEYLGARQQLGRVKAQLGELNPNDPAFAKRYSDIILSNPLAFEHASTAPLAKMALAPVTALATGAIEQRYKLEQIAALGQNALAVAGVRGGSAEQAALIRAAFGGGGGSAKPDAWTTQFGGVSAGGEAAATDGAAAPVEPFPAPNIYSVTGNGTIDRATQTGGGMEGPGAELYPLPTDTPPPPFSPDGTAPPSPGLLPGLAPETDPTQTPTGQNRTFAPAALAPVGEQAAPNFSQITAPPRSGPLVSATPDATDSPVAQASPELLAAARAKGELVPIADVRGDLWIPTKIGADMDLVRYLPAQKGPEKKGYDQIPTKLYPNGVPMEWEYKEKIEASATKIAKFTSDLGIMLKADPDLQRLETVRDQAKTAYEAALREFNAIPKDIKGEASHSAEREAALPGLRKLQFEANKAASDFAHQYTSRMGQIATREDPDLAEMMYRDMQVKAAEAAEEEASKQRQEGGKDFMGPPRPTPETDVTATPGATPLPGPEPDADTPLTEQLAAADPTKKESRAAWTGAKVDALKDLKDLASKLGLSTASVLNTIKSGDYAQLSSMITAAEKRGISSPLLAMRQFSSAAGPTTVRTGSTGLDWGTKKLDDRNHSYLDILRFAIQDQHALKEAGLTLDKKGKVSSGNSYRGQVVVPFTETAPAKTSP